MFYSLHSRSYSKLDAFNEAELEMGPKGPRDCGEKHSEGQCMEKCQGHF